MSLQELNDGTSEITVFRSRKSKGRNATSRREHIAEASDSSNDSEDKNEVAKHVNERKKRKNPMIQSVCF